jgi:hypothetical protein
MQRAKVGSIFGIALLGIMSLAGRSQATVLLFDNFDGYADQAAFQAAWSPIGTSGTLTDALSVSAPNSINFATTAQRNQRSFTESGNPSPSNIIRFSFDFYDSNAAAQPYRQYVNLQDGASPVGSGQLISMGLNNNLLSTAGGGNYYMARILGVDGGEGASNYFKLNDASAPLRSTGWANLRVDISDTNFQFFVNDILSKTIPNAVTLRSYDVVRIGSGLSSTTAANIDNVMVSAVPEPSTWAMLATGATACGWAVTWRKRRRKQLTVASETIEA